MRRALVLAPISEKHLSRLRRSADVTYESWLETRRLQDPAELADRLQRDNVSVLVVEADFVFEEVFQHADPLRFVGVCRNSTAQIDVESATQHGVMVVNAPSRNAQAVAEHALGLMLALARGIPAAHSYVRGKSWENPVEPYISMRGVELAGRTLGVVGLGAIGSRLAQIASALGMNVVAHDPYVETAQTNVVLVSLQALMQESDFVSVHVPLSPDTQSLLDAGLLSRMKPTSYLISVSDATVIDQAALLDVLREGRIAGAALDVFETHPVAPDDPLITLDNVVFTPHLGGATEETIERHSQMIVDDVLRFFEGVRPQNLVNPEVWDSRG